MCGIVGAVASRNTAAILLEGLRRLEYRGYDSAGMALVAGGRLQLARAVGKVSALARMLEESGANASTGIAHTRWATHGAPSENNAHPQVSADIAVVHNGIIENYLQLKQSLQAAGYQFVSETDSEVVAHLMHRELQARGDGLKALAAVIAQIKGAYALCIANAQTPQRLYIARKGSPLVLGLGLGENYVASDQLALQPVTDRFVFLEEGDYGCFDNTTVTLFNADGAPVTRSSEQLTEDTYDTSKGRFKHFMLKEIYEQPAAISRTLAGRLQADGVDITALINGDAACLQNVQAIQIVACGTSYHAGLVARYWFEEFLGLPVVVEIASEYRYRNSAVLANCLLVTVSQSGETADTLAALNKAATLNYAGTLAICNVAGSSLVRQSQMALLTRAGPEIGVASTKAFTSQLTALLLLVAAISQLRGSSGLAQHLVHELRQLPALCEAMLGLAQPLQQLSADFANKHHALFLGRGVQSAVAMEGALKLKEISYIHAEAYAAGELKHGPLALVDDTMPVIAVAPNNDVLDKVKSNLAEVKSRGGILYVFADRAVQFEAAANFKVFKLEHVPEVLAPIAYSIPLQLLAYYVALVKGTDVDQPRNLAKSVTVE